MFRKLMVMATIVLVVMVCTASAEILDLTICEIQTVPIGQDSSFYEGDTVRTSGIVTCGTHLYYAGTGVTFYMQDPDCGDLFSGIMAYDPEGAGFPELIPGDSVTVTAIVSEYLHQETGVSMTELFIIPNGFEFHSFLNPEPPPQIAFASYFDSTGGADSLGEAYEAVLTRVNDLTVDSVVDYGYVGSTWICHDTTGIVYVREASDSIDNGIMPQPGTVIAAVTGVPYHRFGLYHLQPRYMRDFEWESGAPIIGGTDIFPPYPMVGDSVVYTTMIFDPDGSVDEAFVYIRVNLGDRWRAHMLEEYETNYWRYTAPNDEYAEGDRVDYYIHAFDDEGNESKDPFMAPISFYTFDVQAPVPMTIAEARLDDDGDFVPDNLELAVEISGIVTANTFSDTSTNIFVQDATGGINVYYGVENLEPGEGDSVTVRGIVDQYYGKTEVIMYGSDKLTNHGAGTIPVPCSIMCSDLRQIAGEQIEGLLVMVSQVTLIPEPDEWPILGVSANMTIADTSGNAFLRIDRYTDIDGNMEPDSPMNIVGIVGQYDPSAPYDSNYQLMPRKYEDFDPLSSIDDVNHLPIVYALNANYPNPFNPTTTINYQLPVNGDVTIEIYNLLGQKVETLIDGYQDSGYHTIHWNASNYSSGIYFYKMRAGDFLSVKKMTIIK